MKSILFLILLAVANANLYRYLFNSTRSTQFFTFKAKDRKTNEESYYGEILVFVNNGSIAFNAIGASRRYFYNTEKMMFGEECQRIAPPIPDNLESFFKSAIRINRPSSDSMVYDPLVLQYLSGGSQLFKIDYLGLTYVIVIESNKISHVISKHFVIDFIPHSQNVHNIRLSQPPNLHKCPTTSHVYRKSESNFQLEHKNPKLPWYENEKICHFPWLSLQKLCPQSAMNDELKECVFLHGVGIPESWTGTPVPKWPRYWGDVDQYVAKHCSKSTFLRLETQVRGWDNVELQTEACNVMADSDGVIRNKILYVHSMGNNILAGAIKSNRCTIDSETTKWFDAHGPAKGSPTADFLKEVCENPEKSDVLRYIAKVLGYCQKNNTVFPAYETLTPGYPGLDDLIDFVDKHATGRMCGTDPFGLTSKYSAALDALSKFSMGGRTNDGMVNINSCKTTDQEYTNDYHNSHYLAAINHADGTCRDGEGYYGINRQPCSWFAENY